MTKGTVTLAMIVKDEAKNLKDCLESAAGQVDEIVIVDTGSTDGTLEIARSFTNKIYYYPWGGDFSAARNFALEKSGGEWILSLDADEVLLKGSGDLKILIARSNQPEAYLLPLNNPTAQSTGEYNRFLVLRLFKNNRRYRFEGRIHEQIAVTDRGVVGIAEGPVISHKPLPARERNRKRGRNLALLKRACLDDPQNPFLQYYLGVEWLMLGKPRQALPHLRQAWLELTDENLFFRGPALRYLAICLNELGRLDEAIVLCREAVLNYPQFTDMYYLNGVFLEEKREYPEAIKSFNRALECGSPPALYSHMNGAGSFLACYHLGHCHETLGQRKAAIRYYEQALDANHKYIYPLYSLFWVVLLERSPCYTLDYLKAKGYLESGRLALAAARLFFEHGYPDLAHQCLEKSDEDGAKAGEYLFYLGKYCVLSGRLRQGLEHLKRIEKESCHYEQSRVFMTVALLLQGRFAEGRALALELWPKQEARCHALVLLGLTRQLVKGGPLICPQKVRELEVGEVARELLDQCSRYLPGGEIVYDNPWLVRLLSGLEEIIKNNSPRGYLSLLEYYQEKAGGARSFLNHKYGFNTGLARML